MPCLAYMMDCLLCGTQTDCVQMNEEIQADSTLKDKWPKPFCKLLSIEDETLEDKLFESYYCVQCSCKIKSIHSISNLIVNMKSKLTEIKATVEDNLYLSNPHLYGQPADDDENTEPGEKNQNKLRAEMISVLEQVKRLESENKKCDASILTDPVIIVENEFNSGMKKANGAGLDDENGKPETEPYYIILADNSELDIEHANANENEKLVVRSDKASQCAILSDDDADVFVKGTKFSTSYSSTGSNEFIDINDAHSGSSPTGHGQGSKKQRQRQLIKIRINSDSVSEDIINTLRRQSGSGSSQTRQLIIRGYREVEVPQPVNKSRSRTSEGKNPICIDVDNEADISIAQAQQQQQPAVAEEVKTTTAPAPTSRKRGRPPSHESESKNNKSATSNRSKSRSKSKTTTKSRPSKIIQCPVCDAECESMNDRKQHVETTHKEGGFYMCSHCAASFNTERKLFNHQKVHLEAEAEVSDSEDDQEEVEPEVEEVADAYEEEDEDVDEGEAYVDDEDDEDWTEAETTGRKVSSRKSKGRKSTPVVKPKARNSSMSKSLPAVPSTLQASVEPVHDGTQENIEVELVQMNPEEHGDFIIDQSGQEMNITHVASDNTPKPSSGRKSNKRKSALVPIPIAEEELLTPSKRPKTFTVEPVIKVTSNKKVVGLPDIYQDQAIPGQDQGQGQDLPLQSGLPSGGGSVVGDVSPRKSGRLRPKYRQYFY